MSFLQSYGLDSYWIQQAELLRSTGQLARVVTVDRGECDVVTDAGALRVRSARHDVCTGDWVLVDGAEPTVMHVLPRRTAVVRAASGTTSAAQTLAANVDTVVIVVASDTELDLGRIERYTALAWDSGATPLIAVTKSDNGFGRLGDVAAAAPGITVCVVSALTGSGVDALVEHCAGTVALIGPSGSGKSTLANTLAGAEILDTGGVRASDAKGKHTTVRRELIPLPWPGGTIIDTPGLRSVGLLATEHGLQQAFSDIEQRATHCRFHDCTHASEPGCAVVESIDARRLSNYRKLQRENEWATTRHDAQANRQRLRDAKQAAKSLRSHYRSRGR